MVSNIIFNTNNNVTIEYGNNKPSFLDGRNVVTKQRKRVILLKDLTSFMMTMSRKVSNLVRKIYQKRSINKSRQRFWEHDSSNVDDILNVEKPITPLSPPHQQDVVRDVFEFYNSSEKGCYIRVLHEKPCDKSFWGKLLGRKMFGSLNNYHIQAWTLLMYESRPSAARWSVVLPSFISLFGSDEHDVSKFADGSIPPFPAWWDVNRVIFPILLPGHWITGMLNLDTWVFTIFDSYIDFIPKKVVETVPERFVGFLPDFLDKIQYWAKSGRKREFINVLSRMATRVPQQSGCLGDCGVWTCMHMESIAQGRSLVCDTDTAEAAMAYRRRMAMELYAMRTPRPYEG